MVVGEKKLLAGVVVIVKSLADWMRLLGRILRTEMGEEEGPAVVEGNSRCGVVREDPWNFPA